MKDLPVMPEVASKIVRMSGEGIDMSFGQLEEIIKVDAGLTAKILKIANSALYARQREITNLRTAITLLGFKNIRTLVLLVTASTFFQKIKKTRFYQEFWKHGIVTAVMAQDMGARVSTKAARDELFLGGVLHEIGKGVLFNADPDAYLRVLERAEQGGDLEQLEHEVFQTDHRTLGAAVLRNWNFPDLFVDIAAESGSANIDSEFKSTIILITIAGILAEMLGYGVKRHNAETLLAQLVARSELDDQSIAQYMQKYGANIMEHDLVRDTFEMFEVKPA